MNLSRDERSALERVRRICNEESVRLLGTPVGEMFVDIGASLASLLDEEA